MKFPSHIYLHKRKLQASTFWLMMSQFKMVRQNLDLYLWYIWRATAFQHLISCKLEVRDMNTLFFLLPEPEDRIEKSCFSIKSYGSLKIVFRISIFAQKCDVRKIETWGLTGIFFQKFSWCTTTVPNFLFLAYPYPEIWAAGKSDPPPRPWSNSVKNFEKFRGKYFCWNLAKSQLNE